MNKVLLSILTIAAASWFMVISFGVGTYAGMSAICAMEKCSREIHRGDAIPSLFQVMVRDAANSDVVMPVLLSDLSKYMSSNPNSSLHLEEGHGLSTDGNWKYTVTTDERGNQIIEADFQDDASILERYRVSGGGVQPLNYRSRNAGYLFSALPFGMVLAFATRWFARRRLARSSRVKKVPS